MSTIPVASAPADNERRNAILATAAVGGVGALAAAAPFVASFAPSERALAAGAPVEFDLSTVAPGEMKTVEWRGKPVWVLHRTPAMIESVKHATPEMADPDSKRTTYRLPPYADNPLRSIKPEFLIVIGICTHLGCNPIGPLAPGSTPQLGAEGGFLCPCHGSTFDLAGRVFRNKPAPDNLEVPPHKYVSDLRVVIGDDSRA